MSGSCVKCKAAVIFKEPKKSSETFGYPCDHCKSVICQSCCDLSSTEIRAVLLSKRTLPFYCKDCLTDVKKLLGLVDRVALIEQEIRAIKADVSRLSSALEDVDDIKNKLQAVGDSNELRGAAGTVSGASLPEDDIWTEITDRCNRSKNLMLYNVPETDDDSQEISAIMSLLSNEPPPVIRHVRVGKRNVNGFRALKVTLNSSEEVQGLIRHHQKLKGRKVYINLDLTPKQRAIEKSVRTEFTERKSKGEKIQIRYRGGVPTIINVQEN